MILRVSAIIFHFFFGVAVVPEDVDLRKQLKAIWCG
jgi:hypothetical protein